MPSRRAHIHPDVAARLERHEQRRQQGVPTLTVLSGPPGLGARTWRAWIAATGHPPAVCHVDNAREAIRAWIMGAAEHHDLGAVAASAMSAGVGLPPDELRRRLARAPSAERALLLERATDGFDPLLSRICRALLDRAVVASHPDPSRVTELLLEGDVSEPREGWKLAAELSRLLPRGTEPAVLFAAREATPPAGWLHRVAMTAAEALEAHPGLAIAIATNTGLDDLPESRAKALLREGSIALPCLAAEHIAATLAERGVSASRAPASCITRLAADGADEDLVGLYAQAARAAGDDARSEAERFLFARLESLPWAAGRFTLNGRPGFRFGGREAEVDLLARDLGIAIEIDGYYHFLDRDAYRRDRRKDLALQEHGYLVLRFLEEDIVARLEEILDTVARAVDHRSVSSGGLP